MPLTALVSRPRHHRSSQDLSTRVGLLAWLPGLVIATLCLTGIGFSLQFAHQAESLRASSSAMDEPLAGLALALAGLSQMQTQSSLMLGFTLAAALIGGGLLLGGMIVNRRLVRRITAMVGVMTRMADREPAGFIPGLGEAGTIGDMARAVAVFRADTLEIEMRGAELEELHKTLDAALNHMVHGLVMMDADLRIVLCNRSFRALFNFDPDIVRPGTSLHQMIAHGVARGNHPGLSADEVMQALRSRAMLRRAAHFQQRTADGRLLSVHWTPIEGGAWVCTYEDITAREAASARAIFLARHDARTGLPNRDVLSEELAGRLACDTGRGFNLLCLEIDRFEKVADTGGHAAADELLRQVARRIHLYASEQDRVAHLGGPSFAVVQMASARAAGELAERLRGAMEAPFELEGRPVTVSASIGIASALPPSADPFQTAPGLTAAALLRNAGLALHRARADGTPGWHVFEAGMEQEAEARQALERDLRAALELRQFELHYQPLIDVQGVRVAGFEALLRWHHPKRGMVSPAAFIPLAEELGLIGGIGAWVLQTACVEAAGWARFGQGPISVAVNLSPLQFADPDLVEIVAAALAESGLPGALLELEITESVRLQDEAATLATLHRLRGLGARISLDDFGTGYSSLSYLHSFPFDKIKIDQSFVRSLPKAESLAIVRAIAALGASLGITTLAEGVETEAQLGALVREGCSQMQGYLFSRPRPACDVETLVLEAATRMLAAA